ncbi:glutamate receptor 2.7-like protein [Tanacetum coccineum]
MIYYGYLSSSCISHTPGRCMIPYDPSPKPLEAMDLMPLKATNLIDIHRVEALLGLQTLEEVLAVGEIGGEAQIPTFSLLDSVPQWALDRLPLLVQASPSQFAQMKAFVAILGSYGWSRFTFIYEDINSASTQVIPHLMEAIKETDVEISNIVKLSPLASSSSLLEELERINTEQCRVFLVHASLGMGIRLFQNAKTIGMMEKGYVWITTNLIIDLLHTVDSSTFSMMEGVVGLGSFFLDTSSPFHDFSIKFQTNFKMQYPEEEKNTPGIFAVQAYDATWIVALALNERNMSGQKLLDMVSSITLAGISGEVKHIDRKQAPSRMFQIINIIGKYYREVGFWSEGLGFSEVIDDRATYDTSLGNLGPHFLAWEAIGCSKRMGHSYKRQAFASCVPTMALKFDAVVGDVSVVSRRYKYAEFTHPYTETGLVMVVPVTPYHGQCPELQGSPFNQTGILLTLAFTRMFFTNGDELHSNLTRMTAVAWLFAAIIIGQCYTASLTSMLTVRRLIPKVTDYETLKNANAVVGYGRGAHVATYLVDVLGFELENIRSFTSPEGYAHALRNKEISAVFLEAPFTKLFFAKYCKSFTTAGPTFGDGGFAFVLPKGSPMLADFTKALLNVSESGTLREIEKKMLGSEQCVDQDSAHDEYESLGLSSFWSLFVLTGGTSTISLAIYFIISLRNHCQIEWRYFITIISEFKKNYLHRRKQLSRKVSDVDSPKSPNALDMI